MAAMGERRENSINLTSRIRVPTVRIPDDELPSLTFK
jgi:predicted DNA-binding ribbon-helix-helix protein